MLGGFALIDTEKHCCRTAAAPKGDVFGAMGLSRLSDTYWSLLAQAIKFDQADPTATVRQMAHVPFGRVRLESHTLGSALAPVVSAAHEVLAQWQEHGVRGWLARWSAGKSDWIGIQPERIREQFASVIGANPGNVVVRGGLTENLALALRMLHGPELIQSGRSKIITNHLLFPSDMDAIHAQLSDLQRCQSTLRTSDSVGDGILITPETHVIQVKASGARGLFATADFLTALEQHKHEAGTLVIEHQPYLSGQVLDMPVICARARALGYRVIVDAAHSAGVYPLRAQDMQAHIIVGCGYKELLAGPGTLGWMFADMPALEQLNVWMPRGWWGRNIESRFKFGGSYVPDAGASRLLLSTANPIVESMWAAVLACYAEAGGIQVVHRESIQRGNLFLSHLQQHPGFGSTFGCLTPQSEAERSAEIALWFASADTCQRLFEWLTSPDDNGVAIDADTRIAYYNDQEGIMRLGFHPFIVSNQDALLAAQRIYDFFSRSI